MSSVTGLISATIAAGSIIVNDYNISLEEMTDGYVLKVTRGSEVQTALIYGLTDERLEMVLTAAENANSAYELANAAKNASESARTESQVARDEAKQSSSAALQSANDAAEAQEAAEAAKDSAEQFAQLAQQRAFGMTVNDNEHSLVFSSATT